MISINEMRWSNVVRKIYFDVETEPLGKVPLDVHTRQEVQKLHSVTNHGC